MSDSEKDGPGIFNNRFGQLICKNRTTVAQCVSESSLNGACAPWPGRGVQHAGAEAEAFSRASGALFPDFSPETAPAVEREAMTGQ